MATLIHDIHDHGKDKQELAYALGLLFATELNPLGWQALRGSKGNNSWRIYLKRDGKPTKIWYFTGYDKGAILARNNYLHKKVTQQFTIKTRPDAIRFVRNVASQK